MEGQLLAPQDAWHQLSPMDMIYAYSDEEENNEHESLIQK